MAGKESGCKECMWNWQDVHGGAGRICYNRESRYFHQKAPVKRCKKFENRVNPNMKYITISPVRKKRGGKSHHAASGT